MMKPEVNVGLSRGQERLSSALSVVAFPEDIAQVLGIEDMNSMSEEFWTAQVRAARCRFYWMCLNSLGWVLSTEIQDLEEGQAAAVASQAAKFFAIVGFDYADVRSWYKNFGQFAVDQAFEARRERRHLESRCIRVLVIFEKGAKFIAFDEMGNINLVDQTAAHQYSVDSISMTNKTYLLEKAKHFDYLLRLDKAKQVKLLVGPKISD